MGKHGGSYRGLDVVAIFGEDMKEEAGFKEGDDRASVRMRVLVKDAGSESEGAKDPSEEGVHMSLL